ncbi:MAG: ABC transporter ATP-binding protein [Ruminococcaceae bacterium]|nr:ABC transporter ATP-binding protein [Oscillospiraceae bacterium]
MITLKDVYKIYYMGDNEVRAADGINMHITKGEFVAIVGQSGSGKSTCMNIIGCLDTPTEGTYLLNGIDVSTMNDNELAEIRNKMLGFIFQQYNLIPKLTVQENVELPLLYAGIPSDERHERARYQLKRVGLEGKEKNYPAQLSGGQQQRVSIARALAGEPSVILADEPTGALDSRTGKEVMEFLKKLNDEGNTIVLITHDNSIAVSAKRIIRLHDGKIVYDGPSDGPGAVVNSNVSFADDPLLIKQREEAKRRDEEYKKAMAKGITHEEFESYYKELRKREGSNLKTEASPLITDADIVKAKDEDPLSTVTKLLERSEGIHRGNSEGGGTQ